MFNNHTISVLSVILSPTLLFATASFGLPEKLPDESALRGMSYNIRRDAEEDKPERTWNNRLSKVTALIQQINPDIFGLQEPVAHQLTQIKDVLLAKGMRVESFGDGRGISWLGRAQDEYNPILYNPEKVTLLEQSTFQINADPLFGIWIPIWNGLLPRICTWGKFKINATGQEFYFYNTHFDHKFDSAKLLCAKTVAKHIAEQNKEQLPVILVGDFNTDFKDAVQEALIGFQNTKQSAVHCFGPQETSTGWDNEKLKLIDHILKKGNITVMNHAVVPHEGDVYPSDHRPVVADMIID